jgi:hypothetical protein
MALYCSVYFISKMVYLAAFEITLYVYSLAAVNLKLGFVSL